jgi:Class II flagellar assembly regulator
MVESLKARGIGGPSPLDRNGSKTAEGVFIVDAGTTGASQKSRLSSVTSLGLESMLALQSIQEETERDRGARKRGTAMIAALTKLQRAMLAGEDPLSALRTLNDLGTADPITDDPGLGEILRAINLRSRIEMARRECRA